MRWYKRLFWKIFAAIWCVSFLVVLATACVIGVVSEKDRFKELIVAKAEGYAELMVDRYERKGFRTLRPLRKHDKRYRDHGKYDKGKERWDHFKRYDRDRESWQKGVWINLAERVFIQDLEFNRKVVGVKHFDLADDDLYRFTLSSERGRMYEIFVDTERKQSLYMHLLGRVLTAQLFLILLASALAAFAVSAIIVRPLNLLREHSQAIYRGELDVRTDHKLRSRGDELGELARDFDRMADYIEQTLSSHQRLMQDVSHELRAPLARLQAAAGIAEQRLGQEDKSVQRIIRECERLDHLIGELLSLSRLEQMEGQGESLSLLELLQALLDDAQFDQQQRLFQLDLEEDCQVQLNRQLLERALTNIIGNACKHTPVDTAIDIYVVHGERCEIRVRDHGSGVTEEQLAHLCKPFYRADAKTEGYGLGLSIAQRAISRMGGELRMQNHPNGGLEVTLLLPCSR